MIEGYKIGIKNSRSYISYNYQSSNIYTRIHFSREISTSRKWRREIALTIVGFSTFISLCLATCYFSVAYHATMTNNVSGKMFVRWLLCGDDMWYERHKYANIYINIHFFLKAGIADGIFDTMNAETINIIPILCRFVHSLKRIVPALIPNLEPHQRVTFSFTDSPPRFYPRSQHRSLLRHVLRQSVDAADHEWIDEKEVGMHPGVVMLTCANGAGLHHSEILKNLFRYACFHTALNFSWLFTSV